MTIYTGYFNSIKGDRKYNAEQMSRYFNGIIGRGVLQNYKGRFNTTAVSGMDIQLDTGKAYFSDGKYIESDSPIVITLDPSDVVLNRIDRLVLRKDKNEDVRTSTIILKKGTPATNPVAPDLVNNDYVEELSLATIRINKLVESISQSNITNTIPDNTVCGYVTGLIEQVNTTDLFLQYKKAYEEYFKESSAEFEEWFNNLKENLSTSTLLRQYTNTAITTVQNQTVIDIGIPQYNPALDILEVFVNGVYIIEGREKGQSYTKNKSQITLNLPLDINQEVYFTVFKSIDGEKAITVIEQVEELQNEVAELKDYMETLKTGVYVGTGADDNKKLSEIIQTFLNAGNDYKQLEIKVYGTLACTNPISGTGTNTDPTVWFMVGQNNSTSRRVRLDFSQCERISIDNANRSYSVMFAGNDIYMCNCQASMYGATASSIFNGQRIVCDDCEFWLNQNSGINSDIIGCACCGTFTNCRVSVTAQTGKAYGFKANGNILRLINCEVFAYNISSSSNEAVAVLVEANATENVLIMEGCNIPIKARGGYKQSETVKINSGYYSLTNNILGKATKKYASDPATGKTETGTMVISK